MRFVMNEQIVYLFAECGEEVKKKYEDNIQMIKLTELFQIYK